jgi:hypothetical protein
MLSLKRPKHGPATKGVFAEVFIKTESGEEEKEITDICQHIGPSSNDVSSQQLHENDFKSSMLSIKRPKHGPQKECLLRCSSKLNLEKRRRR